MSVKRDPTLHLLRSDLIRLIAALEPAKGLKGATDFVDRLFDAAQPYQLRTRYLQLLQQAVKTKGKLTRTMQADDELPFKGVETFNRFLTAARQGNTFAKVWAIRKDDTEYLQLKEVAALAYEFTKHFEIAPVEDGLKEYIRLGMQMMGKNRYGLNKFKTYHSRIVEAFNLAIVVANDSNAAGTATVYAIWQSKMIEYGGTVENLEQDYTKYAHMVYTREAADDAGADYEDWLTAQFEGLAFMNALPELTQLYTENAGKRWKKSTFKDKSEEQASTDNSLLNYYNITDDESDA